VAGGSCKSLVPAGSWLASLWLASEEAFRFSGFILKYFNDIFELRPHAEKRQKQNKNAIKIEGKK
jgi:hypothetical protein